MTRKEKIALLVNELEDIRCNDYDSGTVQDKTLIEAIRVIKASKQEEPCDNVISRQAVLDILWHTSFRDDYEYKVCKNKIIELPPVTPQPKTGHWIKKEDDTCWWYACSECEQEPLKNRWNDDDVLSKFCPNCGAKMVEPQERSE